MRKEVRKEVIEIMSRVKDSRNTTEEQNDSLGRVVILENLPVRELQGNGVAERAIKGSQHKTRKLNNAARTKDGAEIRE